MASIATRAGQRVESRMHTTEQKKPTKKWTRQRPLGGRSNRLSVCPVKNPLGPIPGTTGQQPNEAARGLAGARDPFSARRAEPEPTKEELRTLGPVRQHGCKDRRHSACKKNWGNEFGDGPGRDSLENVRCMCMLY